MHMLESAMAFAVVMIIFSTIVTGLVEAVLRMAALRQETLERTLRLFLKNEVRPTLVKALGQAKAAVQTVDDSNAFIEKMVKDFTQNPVQTRRRNWFAKLLAPRIEKIDELTAYSFLQRLAKSEMSGTIRSLNDDQLTSYLANITRTYERYMAASSEFYRKKSHILTVFAAMSLAIVFNVPAARVYMHLMDNPESRAELINKADQAMEQNEAAEQSLRRFWDEQSKRAETGVEGGAEGETPSLSDAELAEEEKRIAQQIAALRGSLDALRTDTGLPIGPSMWPYCFGDAAKTNLECQDGEVEKKTWLDLAYWLFNVVLAGVLIGLGGPFWAKVYTRLAQFAGRAPGGGNPELVSVANGEADVKKAAEYPAAAFRIASGDISVSTHSAPPPASDQTG